MTEKEKQDKLEKRINRLGSSIANKSAVTSLGYTPENVANKTTDADGDSDILYPTQKAVKDFVNANVPALYYDSGLKALIWENTITEESS